MQVLTRAALVTALLSTGLTGVATGLSAAPASAATCPSSGGVSVPEASASGDVVFQGHGWGHSLGMSQYGAQGAAKLGCSYRQILAGYYPGSVVSAPTMPRAVFLRMLNDGARADATAETGAVTWQSLDVVGGTNVVKNVVTQPKGTTYRVYRDGTGTKLRIYDPATQKDLWTSSGPATKLRLVHSTRVVRLVTYVRNSAGYTTYMDRRLRWDYTQFGYDGNWFDAVQIIQDDSSGPGMQKYLWGIAEVPTLFPTAALQAQAVAARTYAARLGGGSLANPLMPTPADQNYTGYAKESEDATYGNRWKGAVDTTAKQVLKDSNGGWVTTYYSSSMGGRTEDVRYVGWSTAAVPYLRSIDDSRWEMASGNNPAYRSWAKSFSWSTLAAKLGFSEIASISVPAKGTAARLDGVKVQGVKGGTFVTSYLSGWDVRQALGLLSPGFTIRMTTIGGDGAQPIVGDWDGDGDTDPGWFKNGAFALSMGDGTTKRFAFGMAGDTAVVGDWDGDGDSDIGVFRTGSWYLRNGLSAGPHTAYFRYGQRGDRPVIGRWNGSTLGIGVVRGNTWFLRHTLTPGATEVQFNYGADSDRPVVGDWDHDGDTTVGMVRGNHWFLRQELSGPSAELTYGSSTDRPVVGDWNGDRSATVGVARGRTFYLRDLNTSGVATRTVSFAG